MKCLLKSDEVNLFPIVDVFPIFCILPLISNDMTLHMWHTLVGQTQLQHESSSASWHRKARQIFLAIIDIGLVIATVVFSIFGTILDWEEWISWIGKSSTREPWACSLGSFLTSLPIDWSPREIDHQSTLASTKIMHTWWIRKGQNTPSFLLI